MKSSNIVSLASSMFGLRAVMLPPQSQPARPSYKSPSPSFPPAFQMSAPTAPSSPPAAAAHTTAPTSAPMSTDGYPLVSSRQPPTRVPTT